MGRRWGLLAIAGLGASFAVHITGCSVMGLATGAMIDANKPPHQHLPASEVSLVSPGTPVTVLMDDGRRIHGTYRGISGIRDGDAPQVSQALRIEGAGGVDTVGVDHVVLIQAPTQRHAARTGFLVGLAVDVIVVAIASSNDSGHSSGGCEQSSYSGGWGY